MTFHEKLSRRVAELSLNKAKASHDVGLPRSTIGSYLAKPKSLPRVDIALKIARALRVPLEWLADDDKDFPPPNEANSNRLADVPHGEFVRELGRRYRLEVLDALAAFDAIEKEDWSKTFSAIKRLKSSDKVPTEIVRQIDKIRAAIDAGMTALARYNPELVADFLHDQLPGKERAIEELQSGAVMQRFNSAMKRPDLGGIMVWMNDNTDLLRSLKLKSTIGISHLLDLLKERKRTEMLSGVRQT